MKRRAKKSGLLPVCIRFACEKCDSHVRSTGQFSCLIRSVACLHVILSSLLYGATAVSYFLLVSLVARTGANIHDVITSWMSDFFVYKSINNRGGNKVCFPPEDPFVDGNIKKALCNRGSCGTVVGCLLFIGSNGSTVLPCSLCVKRVLCMHKALVNVWMLTSPNEQVKPFVSTISIWMHK